MKYSGRMSGLNWFAAGVVAVFALPFLGVGVYEVYQVRRLHDTFVRTEGTVVANTYSRAADDEGGAYFPVVEFETAKGKARFTDGVGSLPADYAPGERVPVLYDPQNPARGARLYSWKRVWLAPVLFIFVGLLPIVVPFGVFWAISRRLEAAAARRLAERHTSRRGGGAE